MLKTLCKFIWIGIYNILEWICRLIYLMLPLGFHMFALQMREKINPVTTLTTFVDENSTWTIVYPGLAMVNTDVGAVRRRLNNAQMWIKKYSWLWVTLTVLVIIVLLTIITIKVI